jgi:hypothetical protein
VGRDRDCPRPRPRLRRPLGARRVRDGRWCRPAAPAERRDEVTPVAVAQALAGLQTNTTYHYRLIALGPAGAVNGADRAFKTPRIPLSLQIAGVPNPVVFGAPFVIEGTRVTFHVRRTRRRGRVRLYGTVTPAEVGALVGFQRLVPGGGTVNRGGAVVRALDANSSRFSRVVRVRHRGLFRALVKINDGAHVSAYSAPILVP